MLKKLMLLGLITLIVSCQEETEKTDGFVLNNTIDSFYSGRKIKLTRVERNKNTTIDSAIITNGKAVLKGKVDSPDLYYIFIDDYKGTLPLMIENVTMDIALHKDSLDASTISGSKENDVFQTFKDFAKPLRKHNAELAAKFKDAQSKGDMAGMQAVRKTFDSLVNINNQYSLKNIEKYNDAAVSAVLLEDFLKAKVVDIKEAETLYANFTDYVKESRAAKNIKRIIDATSATEIGSIAPNFSAPNPEGETIALNDIKGKVTIIDFWAAWCGPCRRENPNVVKIYNKYHDQGLEIIGVSLDGNTRQSNPKKDWLAAIEKDGLTWHQVSNLKYFNDPIAKKYHIQAIPATFILDSDGKIVAKNLRGDELDAKIAELLK